MPNSEPKPDSQPDKQALIDKIDALKESFKAKLEELEKIKLPNTELLDKDRYIKAFNRYPDGCKKRLESKTCSPAFYQEIEQDIDALATYLVAPNDVNANVCVKRMLDKPNRSKWLQGFEGVLASILAVSALTYLAVVLPLVLTMSAPVVVGLSVFLLALVPPLTLLYQAQKFVQKAITKPLAKQAMADGINAIKHPIHRRNALFKPVPEPRKPAEEPGEGNGLESS